MEGESDTHDDGRAASESAFYDEYADRIDLDQLDPGAVFPAISRETAWMMKQFGDLAGKKVLDIGCGQGDTSVWFALQGAEVTAVDVSAGLVRVAAALAARHGVSGRVRTLVGKAEELDLEAGSYDLIFCDGVLHHIDFRNTLPRLVGLLKPGGLGLFMEPQVGNPFMRLYRHFASDIRTADERPLTPDDVAFITGLFATSEHREYHLKTLPLMACKFMAMRLRGERDPYWMESVRRGGFAPRTYRFLQSVDELILRRSAGLSRWAWMTVIAGRR